MEIDYLSSSAASNSTFRVLCGEMLFEDIWNVHSSVEFGFVTEGVVAVETSEGSSALKKGDIYFVAPNQKHKITDSGNGKVNVILLNLDNSGTLVQEFVAQSIIKSMMLGNCTKFAHISPGNEVYYKVCDCFREIYTAEAQKPKFFQLFVTGKMYEIFFLLFQSEVLKIYDVEAQGKQYRALRRVTEYINENFCDGLSLEIIAEKTGLSRYYISHLFKNLMNTTFIGYLNELRLSRAAIMLTTTNEAIADIAEKSGFNNISNFNRAFRLKYNMTPSRYRKTEKIQFSSEK